MLYYNIFLLKNQPLIFREFLTTLKLEDVFRLRKMEGVIELSKAGKTNNGAARPADWVDAESMELVLMALMPENRLVMRLALATGRRISDLLNLKTSQILRDGKVKNRITIRELKTGKKALIYIPVKLRDELLKNAGEIYLFEGRDSKYKHRTRQAVAKDLKRARKILRMDKLIVSAHSARKIWAVEQYKHAQTIEQIQKQLNHSDPAITMIYAMADEMTKRRLCRRH
jgi:integrase